MCLTIRNTPTASDSSTAGIHQWPSSQSAAKYRTVYAIATLRLESIRRRRTGFDILKAIIALLVHGALVSEALLTCTAGSTSNIYAASFEVYRERIGFYNAAVTINIDVFISNNRFT